MIVFLTILLIVSLLLNAWLWYRWQTYRTRPSGNHSYTGMMQKITPEMIEADRNQQ